VEAILLSNLLEAEFVLNSVKLSFGANESYQYTKETPDHLATANALPAAAGGLIVTSIWDGER
jgi:hypothetical protein